MARFAYYTVDGASLSWAKRLMDEGNEVLLYVEIQEKKGAGQGIVPCSSNKEEWIKWGLQDPMTIFFFDQTRVGDLADRLRKSGKLVVGGGSFMDKLETKREFGVGIAERSGIMVPPTVGFKSITETINYLQSNPEQQFGDGGWAWKPDRELGCDATLVAKDSAAIIDHVEQIRHRFGDNIKCILQEKIDGVAVSTARWWTGRTWDGPYEATIENKKFMDGNLGPATGCSLNVVWFYKDENPKIAQHLQFEKLAAEFRKNDAPPGLYDINCILDSQAAWFLEWTPRLGIDSELTSQRGISNLGHMLLHVAQGKSIKQFFDNDFVYCSVRLSVPPYPAEGSKMDKGSPALKVPIRGFDGLWNKYFVCAYTAFDPKLGLHCMDPDGFIGVCLAKGNSIEKTFGKVYNFIKEHLKVPDLQYRTDAVKIIQDDVKKMLKFGWKTTTAMRP